MNEQQFYLMINWMIDRANDLYRKQFRAHCEDVFGDRWRADRGIGVIERPEIVNWHADLEPTVWPTYGGISRRIT